MIFDQPVHVNDEDLQILTRKYKDLVMVKTMLSVAINKAIKEECQAIRRSEIIQESINRNNPSPSQRDF